MTKITRGYLTQKSKINFETFIFKKNWEHKIFDNKNNVNTASCGSIADTAPLRKKVAGIFFEAIKIEAAVAFFYPTVLIGCVITSTVV